MSIATKDKSTGDVTLVLTAEEAATLLYVIGFGHGGNERGEQLGGIYRELYNADVENLYEGHGSTLLSSPINIDFK